MPERDDHVRILDKRITELSDALSHLGKGTDLKELIKVIRFPGYTTPAELAFTLAIVESMQTHVAALNNQSMQLLAASKLVVTKDQAAR